MSHSYLKPVALGKNTGISMRQTYITHQLIYFILRCLFLSFLSCFSFCVIKTTTQQKSLMVGTSSGLDLSLAIG